MKLVCISDTHCQLNCITIPSGDVLVHAGDLTYRGTVQEISKELMELSKHKSKFKHIVLVAGNHDWLAEKQPELMKQMCEDKGLIYLDDSGIEIEGIKFWGSPVQPEFCNWAFNRNQIEIQDHWDLIPEGTDVLITHGPPHGILDEVREYRLGKEGIKHCGCTSLRNKILEVIPKLHIFGHIHPSWGEMHMSGVHFVNASLLDDRYVVVNSPIVVIL